MLQSQMSISAVKMLIFLQVAILGSRLEGGAAEHINKPIWLHIYVMVKVNHLISTDWLLC